MQSDQPSSPPRHDDVAMTASSARAAALLSNLKAVQARVDAAASGRNIRIVAVSKLMPVNDISALYAASLRHFGENYAQELSRKAALLPADVRWHFIGGLQTRHCKTVARIRSVWCVSSVDTAQKAEQLDAARSEQAEALHVHVQVNTSGEDAKAGVRPGADTVALCRFVADRCSRLRLLGLMTIGSIARSHETAPNVDFVALVQQRRLVAEDLGRDDLELSMGMSADFEAAIAMGSGEVRIGSTIFGERPAKADAQLVLPTADPS